MIDKITLFFPYFNHNTSQSNQILNIYPNNKYESKIHFKDIPLIRSSRHRYQLGEFHYMLLNHSLFIHFSAPKIYCKETNYYPLVKSQFKEVIDMAIENLLEIGIDLTVSDLRASEVELFKNIQTEHPVKEYLEFLNPLHIPSMNKRSYETGITWSNKSHSISFYDKIEEMRKRGISVENYPKCSSRLEWRLKRAVKVRKSLGFDRLSDIIDKYDDLIINYNNFLSKNLFSYPMTDFQNIQVSSFSDQYNCYENRDGKFKLCCLIKDIGWENFARTYKFEELETVLREKNKEMKETSLKVTLNRYRKIYRAAELRNTLKEKPSSSDYSDLYNELKTKALS